MFLGLNCLLYVGGISQFFSDIDIIQFLSSFCLKCCEVVVSEKKGMEVKGQEKEKERERKRNREREKRERDK